ncbi:MAG: hypothetical protein JXA58_08020 [Dehalococcoidia bacterium]|nr:hypothetical protein [Dehalococcoidia bacterium]
MSASFRNTSVLVLAACSALLAATGCGPDESDGFAIYLTRHNVPPAQMEALSHVDIADEPIISMGDVVAYDEASHEMQLTQQAFDRLVKLEVPVSGTSFVVCVDSQPVYWGAFWTPISSQSFDGVTIWQPLGTRDPTMVQLQLGYPAAEAYEGQDPRNAPDVLCALQEAGKLQSVSEASTCPLPHGMKGYELYSWQEDNEWHFTLISGTNRNKAAAEIVAHINIVSEDGWVQLHVVGVEAIETTLSRLPPEESVYWLSALTAGNQDIVFSLPPQSVVDEVIEHAATCGLDLRVATR